VRIIVDIDATTKIPWETPAAVAITDTDSRADETDITMLNLAVSG